jgi:glutamate 5-kinase
MSVRHDKIVVKLGSNSLTRSDGKLDLERISHLVEQVSILRKKGVQVIIVSSGAVAAGRSVFSSSKRLDLVSGRQLWSALGQVELIKHYSDFFKEYGLSCAQVLTTKENFGDRQHYLNMRNCISTLLENGVIPVVNENDTISVTELMFTDNDELSGLIASMMDVNALMLLTNVDGVYHGTPGAAGSELISTIKQGEKIDDDIISSRKSNFGRGGMLTKCSISSKLAGQGVAVYIANGRRENILLDLMSAETDVPHTYFEPAEKMSTGVKKWLAHSDDFAKGEVFINDGAVEAILSNKANSLLLIGIVGINGYFKEGEIVRVRNMKGDLLGLGKASYSSKEAKREKGAKNQKPFVHYDHLYLV